MIKTIIIFYYIGKKLYWLLNGYGIHHCYILIQELNYCGINVLSENVTVRIADNNGYHLKIVRLFDQE